MGKSAKSKKEKVPKITEEEYTAYVASLREMTQAPAGVKMEQEQSLNVDGLKKE